jgi:hypothetical protein
VTMTLKKKEKKKKKIQVMSWLNINILKVDILEKIIGSHDLIKFSRIVSSVS